MSESGEERGFQISLKWLLIGYRFAGAGLGLLGRLFYHDANQFRLAIILVMVVAPFLLAVGTIIRLGWRSRRRSLMAWGSTDRSRSFPWVRRAEICRSICTGRMATALSTTRRSSNSACRTSSPRPGCGKNSKSESSRAPCRRQKSMMPFKRSRAT